MNEVVFTNGPSRRPYVEILELFVEKEQKLKWVVTVGEDRVLAFDSELKEYTVMGERLALTDENKVWGPRLTAHWNLKSQAKEALIAALKEDEKLGGFGFLFWGENFNNTQKRDELLIPPIPNQEDHFKNKMTEAEQRVNQEASEALKYKQQGFYLFKSHGASTRIKIEDGKLFSFLTDSQKWYPAFLCADQIKKLVKE